MRLFDPSAETFTTNGLGVLTDAISCFVYQILNGEYELEMQYPVDGIHFSEIVFRSIITAKPEKISGEQPFRVYRITKPLNGIVTVYARHIAYDMSGFVVTPFTASTLGLALQGLKTNAVPSTCPFTFQTDKSVSSPFSVNNPKSLWVCLGGEAGSILQTYSGEWEFDGFTAKLWNKRGSNRGVSIRYGKNMTSYEQDQNCSNVYTAVYPFWTNGTTTVTLPEHTIDVEGTFDYTRILPLDLSQSFQEQPTEAQLRSRAQKYITDNEIGVPDVNWTIEFVQLEESEEYKDKALLERISIGDTVTVEFERYGVKATARAVEVTFNALLDRYESITLGKVRANMADTIVQQQKEIDGKPSVTLVQQITSSITESILGALGGCVRLLDTNNDGMPDELYIADNADPALAVKVWRYNYQGWAASSNGYNGPFSMGATLDDGLLATFVTAANLVAGTIQSADGTSFYLNLDENVLRMSQVTNMESTLSSSIASSLDAAKDYTDQQLTAEASSTDAKIATEASNRDTAIANATNGISEQIEAVESNVNTALIPMNELLQYIQVGNIGTELNPLYGVKIGKVDLATAFKALFTATALEFYENNVRTAFLSNQKLNATTVRTAALELVESANMADESEVDWLVTLDNGYTIKYVGGGSS